MKRVSEILKNFRKEKRITQPELGEILKVTQQYISLVENEKSSLSEEVLKELKEIMGRALFEELEQSFYFEKLPKNLKEKFINNNSLKIPYFKDINASAGNGYLNFCDLQSTAKEYLEINYNVDHKNCIAININGDSMWPELQDKDIVIVNCSKKSISGKGFFIVKYKDEIYSKQLLVKDGFVIGLKSINPMYKLIEIKSDEEFEIIGKIESVYREFL